MRVPVTGRSIAVAPHPSSDSLRVTLRSVLMRNRVRPSLECWEDWGDGEGDGRCVGDRRLKEGNYWKVRQE